MVTTVVVLLIAVALPIALLAGRWAWSCQRRRLSVWWSETLQPVVHPPRTLDVAALQRRIYLGCLSEVSVSGRGVAVLPASFAVEVSDDDAERLAPLVHIVEAELADALGTEATKKQWVRPEQVRVTIDPGDVVDGRPRVRAVLGPDAVDRPAARGRGEHPTFSALAAGGDGDGRRRTVLDRTTPRRTTVELAPPPPTTAAAGTQRLVVCELISADGGRDIDLTDRSDRLTVGRTGTGVVLDDERVSSRHAELVAAGGQWLLHDADSLNGTWVNGRRVERANLVHGDEISFASEGPRFLFSRLADVGR